MPSKFNAQLVERWIPKKLGRIVQQVDEDSEVIEVVLAEGFTNVVHCETVWIFDKSRYQCGDYTLKQIKADLRSWLAEVKDENQNV